METLQRPSRDELFIRTAQLFAERSTCKRGHVGCVLVKQKRIISTGYAGAPANLPDCYEVGCELSPLDQLAALGAAVEGKTPPDSLGCQRTIHAELNAVAYAARAGISTAGATAYCTHSPCKKCAHALSAAGVNTIVYDKEYRLTPWTLLDELDLKIYQYGNRAGRLS